MFDFNPFITNDGSVGLYSKTDNDIYHSVYGALSESYEKFIFPANLNYYLKNKSEINFLDICFGIGYNTKSLIQFLINFDDSLSIDYSIYTDKIINKDDEILSTCSETIRDDKILRQNCKLNIKKNFFKKSDLKSESIHSDKNLNNNFKNISVRNYKFKIDSVDLNKNLIMLSPFIKNKFDYKNILEIDLPEVKKFKNKIKVEKLNKEYQISNYVLKLLFDNLIKSDYFDLDFVYSFINEKKYSNIFSHEMRAVLNEFYKSAGIIYPKKHFLSILHNIYYQYLSKRLIKGCKIPKNKVFDINIIYNSAVDLLMTSDKIYDVVFLDAFTPAKCPKLWTVDFFKLIFDHLSDDGIVLTYSNSAQVRNAFLNSGFYVGKNYSEIKNKSYGTIATKNKSLIKYFLDEYEHGLLKTKAGIFYRDKNFLLSDEDIIKNYKSEFESSTLMTSSKFKKLHSI